MGGGVIRLGLCCKFHREPIAFKTTTAAALARLPRARQLDKLAALALANADALQRALAYCADHGIGAFRVNSQILPVKTHPQQGYAVGDLPESGAIVAAFEACGRFARRHGLRLTFHPDQFILLSAPDPEIVRRSVLDLIYQTEVADWICADVINIHAGGGYGDKPAALARLAAALASLPVAVRARLTLENDDRIYTPADLLPFCETTGTPFVYDVHHHRCLPDGLTVSAVTARARATWDREPLLHVSSPKEGYGSRRPGPHHDFIDPDDFPEEWRALDATVEVEAKAKEVAIERLQAALAARGVPLTAPGSRPPA
ncbi:MAG: UV DNA damage repair endonuclease UvsE [Lentisphaerae bacterium]|jgi:UV DNA damage endonuclease|nr:UV DNA damage repair endonuclease UvsE [Lentisphaerota bacterium]